MAVRISSRGSTAGRNGEVSSVRGRKCESFFSGVHGDDPCSGCGLEDLDRYVPETSDPDDDGRRPRRQLGPAAAHCVIRGEPGVGEWSRGNGIETLRERNEKARRGDKHELGHAPVQAETSAPHGNRSRTGIFAVCLDAELATRASSASPGPVHRDRLANLQVGDARAECMDPPRVLVPECERRAPREHASFEFAHQVQVGVTRTRTSDSDDHLLWTWDGVAHLHQNRVGLPLQESQRPHQIHLFLASRLSGLRSNPTGLPDLCSDLLHPMITSMHRHQ